MTSYYFSIGYNAGNVSRDQAWEELKKAVTELREDTKAILKEARDYNAPETCEGGCYQLQDFADAYKGKYNDLTIVILEEHTEHDDNRRIVQYTGGGPDLKKHVRRAFCRLVIQAMHRKRIEINLNVH